MAARRVVVLKFQDQVAPSRLALQRLAPPAPREQLAAMVGDRLGRGRGVARIRLRIGDVDARDDVTFGHDGSFNDKRARLARLRSQSSWTEDMKRDYQIERAKRARRLAGQRRFVLTLLGLMLVTAWAWSALVGSN